MRYIVSSRSAVPPSGGLGQVDQSRHSDRDAPITVTYNKDNQVISEKNSKTGDKIKYVYDDNGNLIEKKTKGKSTVYSYDTENRLRSVTKGGQILLAATYDGDGNKVFQMSRKYVDGTKQTSKKKKVKTATIQEADDDSDGECSDETASNETNREAKIPTVKETFDPDIFWYGGTQGVMKLTAGQCPALLTAIGKEIRDLWHGFKTFVTGDYTEINMGQNVGKTAEEKNGDTLTANEMATIVVPGTERATLVTWDITNYLNDTNFNENTQVMYQYDQDGKEKASYTYGEADQRISGDLTKEAVKYTEQKAGDYSYLYDGQGNVINTVRNGAVAESYSYDPFGEMTAEGKEGTSKTPLEAQNDNGLSDNDVLWGYNGEEYIEEVGLQYLRQRHYSPETGTFTSQDTNEGDLTNPLSQNRYIYAENDPVNGNDPGGDKKKAKKASTKKTNKKSSKSSSKSSKKTSKKTNKKTTSKKSPSKKKTTLKWNGKKAWKNLKSYMKGRWKGTKKGIKKAYTVIRDKATALKKSVTCKKKNPKTTHNMILTNQYHGYIKGNSKLGKTKFTNQKQTKSTKIIGVSLPVAAIGAGLVSAGVAGGVIAGGSGAITASRGTSLASKGLKSLQKLIKTGVKLPPAVKKGFKIGFTLAVPSTVMGTVSDISSSTANLSKKQLKHIVNKHIPSIYAQQLGRRPKDVVLRELNEKKTFFNKNWDKSLVEEAVIYGHRQASKENAQKGLYTFSYKGEKITLYYDGKGQLQSAYGDYKYSYQELLRIAK